MKKHIALFLALVMALSLFAGCGKTESPTVPETSDTVQTPETPAEPEVPAEPEEPEEEIPATFQNLILIIGDGMGPGHETVGQLFEGETYSYTTWPNKTTVTTDSWNADGDAMATTDSSAAATAIATGTLTRKNYAGKDKDGNDLETIMDIAKNMGKSVGIVTSDYLFEATPAGFSAHTTNRDNKGEITVSQTTSNVDLLCGRDHDYYVEYYTEMFAQQNYYVAKDVSDTAALMAAQKACLILHLEDGSEQEIALKDASLLGLDFLDRNENGFVLMIEQARIDNMSHDNKIAEMTENMISMNDTVDAVMAWIGDRKDTAVIVTADHDTGGLLASAMPDYPEVYDAGSAVAYYQWQSKNHTNTPVNLYVYGPKVDFAAISQYGTADQIQNVDIFTLMKQIIGVEG